MPKRMVGSLIVADAEPLPTPDNSPTSLTASLRRKLGSFVRPVGGRGFIAESMLRVGPSVTLKGRTYEGKQASMIVTSAADIEPRWVSRIASVIRIAWTAMFDPMIKALIREHGLPVDDDVNWDIRLHSMYAKAGIAVNDEDLRNEAIQSAIVSIMVYRDSLASFDPDKLAPEEGEAVHYESSLSLEKKVTTYLTMLFRWQIVENGGTGEKVRYWNNQGVQLPPSVEDTLAADAKNSGGIPEDLLTLTDLRGLEIFRQEFERYLRRFQSPAATGKVMLLFDLISDTSGGREVKAEWMEETGTSYSMLRKVEKILGEELLHFSRSVKAPPIQLTQLITTLRQRTRDIEDDTIEDVVTPKDEDTEGAPGTKAKAMGVSAAVKMRQSILAATGRSLVYLKLHGDASDPRYMVLQVFSHGDKAISGGPYRIETGDFSTDPGLPQEALKKQISELVNTDSDPELSEKIERWLWSQAVKYFEVPLGSKPSWSAIVKLDVSENAQSDIQMSIVSSRSPVIPGTLLAAPGLIVASTTSSHARRVSRTDLEAWRTARSLSSELNLTPSEQTDFAPYPDKTAGEVIPFNKTPQAVKSAPDYKNNCHWCGVKPRRVDEEGRPDDYCQECGDRLEHQDRMERNPEYAARFQPPTEGVQASHKDAKAPGHAYKDGEGKWVCRGCAKGKREKFGEPYNPDDPAIQGKTCSRCYKTLGTPDEKLKKAHKLGSSAFDPEVHDPEALPSPTRMARYLRRNGVDPSQHAMQAAVEGFTSARDGHTVV